MAFVFTDLTLSVLGDPKELDIRKNNTPSSNFLEFLCLTDHLWRFSWFLLGPPIPALTKKLILIDLNAP